MSDDKIDTTKFLPHGLRMQLIDLVVCWDEQTITCETASHTRVDHPLRSLGVLPITAYIEYAAQVAGLHLGLLQRKHALLVASNATRPAAGYIGTVKDVQFHHPIPDSGVMQLRAELLIREQHSAMYQFSMAVSGTVLAEGRITVSQS